MPFKEATSFIEDYSTNRSEAIQKGERLKWATSDYDSVELLLKEFDRQEDHDRWEALSAKEAPDINKRIGLNIRIGWLCSAARDLRLQYAAGADNDERNSTTHWRHSIPGLQLTGKCIARFKNMIKERAKPL